MEKLQEALEEDNLLKVKTALKQGADLNGLIEISEDEYAPVLFFALRKRVSLEIIKFLVEQGADLHYCTDDGVSLLDEAVIFGKLDTIRYLVEECKMDITKTKRKSGLTPFMQACCYGDMEVLTYILSHGIDLDERDQNGMRAIDYAKKLGQKRVYDYLKSLDEHEEF